MGVCDTPITTGTCNQNPQVEDMGTSLEVTFYECTCVNGVETIEVVDISTATVLEIILKKPDDTVVTFTASFVTDGTDGAIRYLTQAGDLDQEGLYWIQGRIVMPTGTWRSALSKFRVKANL